jgi:3-hydroxybutyryl-CoA dehydrogenase
MKADEIKNVTVVGAGLMGSGIAQEFAAAGYPVTLHDASEASFNIAIGRIKSNLILLNEFGLVTTEQLESIPAAIHTTADFQRAVANADLVVEAVVEDIDIKRTVFTELDKYCPERTILTSTTSTIKPETLASATHRPDRVVVTHFGIPNYLIPLVEMARSPETSDETVNTVYQVLQNMGKRPIVMKKAMTGFIVNRLQMAMLREAMNLVGQDAVTPEDIDIAVQNNFGLRLAISGPLEVFDMAGLNTLQSVYSYIMPELSNSTDIPAPIAEAVERGDFGLATGKGLYDWTPESADELRLRVLGGLAEAAKRRQAS